MKAFEKLIQNSNYFIDVGAQTGIYSLAAYQSKKFKELYVLILLKNILML